MVARNGVNPLKGIDTHRYQNLCSQALSRNRVSPLKGIDTRSKSLYYVQVLIAEMDVARLRALTHW